MADPFLISRRQQLVELAARNMMPALYPSRVFADVGGLMSYASSTLEMTRQLDIYIGKILKGAKPSDPDGSMVGTTFNGGAGYGVVYRLTFPPSVSIQPAPVTAIRTGRGILSSRASAVILNGQAPYSYSWSVDSAAFTIHRPGAQHTSISAALAACDSAEGSLSVTITDAAGRLLVTAAANGFRL